MIPQSKIIRSNTFYNEGGHIDPSTTVSALHNDALALRHLVAAVNAHTDHASIMAKADETFAAGVIV